MRRFIAILTWGSNAYGQLGDGTTFTRWLPVAVSALNTATQVSAGARHTCARISDGSARCWGSNGSGRLGNGANGGNALTPVTIVAESGPGALSGVLQVVAGSATTCALIGGGTAKCWGDNAFGRLGAIGLWPAQRSRRPVTVTAP
jgi:alpha-tubulin suppressor-like RCC1 family protein